MATKQLIFLLLVIVGASLPVAFDGSWFSWVKFIPLWLIAFFLAQIVAFRLFGINVAQTAEDWSEDK